MIKIDNNNVTTTDSNQIYICDPIGNAAIRKNQEILDRERIRATFEKKKIDFLMRSMQLKPKDNTL